MVSQIFRKNFLFNLFAIISISELLLLFGVVFFDLFYQKVYISIYSILRIIYKIHFVFLPINFLFALVEYFYKVKILKSNFKITNKLKIFYIFSIFAFIIMTLICLIAGQPPTPEELRFD